MGKVVFTENFKKSKNAARASNAAVDLSNHVSTLKKKLESLDRLRMFLHSAQNEAQFEDGLSTLEERILGFNHKKWCKDYDKFLRAFIKAKTMFDVEFDQKGFKRLY